MLSLEVGFNEPLARRGKMCRIGNTMTFAVIKTGGKQYKVKTGDVLRVEKLKGAEKGQEIVLNEVLLVDDGQSTKLGHEVASTKINATVVENNRAKKVMVIHYKNKVRYFKKYGHRQPFTKIKIGEIK